MGQPDQLRARLLVQRGRHQRRGEEQRQGAVHLEPLLPEGDGVARVAVQDQGDGAERRSEADQAVGDVAGQEAPHGAEARPEAQGDQDRDRGRQREGGEHQPEAVEGAPAVVRDVHEVVEGARLHAPEVGEPRPRCRR